MTLITTTAGVTLVAITMSEDYQSQLDKALQLVRQLEIDQGLAIMYQLLARQEKNLELVERIYALELRRPLNPGFERICQHIFSQVSAKTDWHQKMISSYIDYQRLRGEEPALDDRQLFNLLPHLARSHLKQTTARLVEKVKTRFAEDPRTPEALKQYCQTLIAQKKLILATQEVKYLVRFYGETPQGRWANAQLVQPNPGPEELS